MSLFTPKMHDTWSAKLALAVSGSTWPKMAVSLWKLPRDGHVFGHLTKDISSMIPQNCMAGLR